MEVSRVRPIFRSRTLSTGVYIEYTEGYLNTKSQHTHTHTHERHALAASTPASNLESSGLDSRDWI